jgi:hypothetical protein
MKLYIVPNYIRDRINAKLFFAFLEVPEAAEQKEALYQRLLAHLDDFGVIPDFQLTKEVQPWKHH